MTEQKARKEKRPAPLSIRVSNAERALLIQRAGPLPLSTYLKSLGLDKDAPSYRTRRRMPREDSKLLGQILMHLGASRVPNNLNQIAKHLNQGTLVLDDELAADLLAAVEDVAWIRATLTQALGVER